VQSLDAVPVAMSRKILVSLGARAVPAEGNKLPFNVEPIDGGVSINAPAGLKVYYASYGQMVELPTSYVNGHYKIDLPASMASRWLTIMDPVDFQNQPKTTSGASSTLAE
jgi:hypothetical protein